MSTPNLAHIRHCLKIVNRYIKSPKLRIYLRQSAFQQAQNEMVWRKRLINGGPLKGINAEATPDLLESFNAHSRSVWLNSVHHM